MAVMLSERQQSILEAVVKEYVASAEPVASAELVRKYRLPYSSATVRNELQSLDEAGFIVQPHTSAGRVPTDKGYRYFINRNLQESAKAPSPVSNREDKALKELCDLDDPIEFVRQSSRVLSELTRNFIVAGFPGDDVFFKSGIHEVMQAPEFSNVALMQGFSALVDMIEDELTRTFDSDELEEPRTFIGDENPIREARPYGMIISTHVTPFHKESVIALIGPKRMDYGRNIGILKHFHELMER